MAPVDVNPLFVVDADTLFELIRMKGTDTDQSGAATVVRQAIQWARLKMYERLGTTRVNALVAIAPVSNAATQDHLDRERAGQLEVHLVRWKAMQDLPVLFMDTATATGAEVFNEEAFTRGIDPGELSGALDRLWALAEEDFALLDGDPDTTPGARSELFDRNDGAECMEPGLSVFTNPRNIWLRTSEDKAGGSRGGVDG